MKIIYTIVPPFEEEMKWMVMKRWISSQDACVDYKIPRFYRFESEQEAENFILLEKLAS